MVSKNAEYWKDMATSSRHGVWDRKQSKETTGGGIFPPGRLRLQYLPKRVQLETKYCSDPIGDITHSNHHRMGIRSISPGNEMLHT